jgi:hypothetical protein
LQTLADRLASGFAMSGKEPSLSLITSAKTMLTKEKRALSVFFTSTISERLVVTVVVFVSVSTFLKKPVFKNSF